MRKDRDYIKKYGLAKIFTWLISNDIEINEENIYSSWKCQRLIMKIGRMPGEPRSNLAVDIWAMVEII